MVKEGKEGGQHTGSAADIYRARHLHHDLGQGAEMPSTNTICNSHKYNFQVRTDGTGDEAEGEGGAAARQLQGQAGQTGGAGQGGHGAAAGGGPCWRAPAAICRMVGAAVLGDLAGWISTPLAPQPAFRYSSLAKTRGVLVPPAWWSWNRPLHRVLVSCGIFLKFDIISLFQGASSSVSSMACSTRRLCSCTGIIYN